MPNNDKRYVKSIVGDTMSGHAPINDNTKGIVVAACNVLGSFLGVESEKNLSIKQDAKTTFPSGKPQDELGVNNESENNNRPGQNNRGP